MIDIMLIVVVGWMFWCNVRLSRQILEIRKKAGDEWKNNTNRFETIDVHLDALRMVANKHDKRIKDMERSVSELGKRVLMDEHDRMSR